MTDEERNDYFVFAAHEAKNNKRYLRASLVLRRDNKTLREVKKLIDIFTEDLPKLPPKERLDLDSIYAEVLKEEEDIVKEMV